MRCFKGWMNTDLEFEKTNVSSLSHLRSIWGMWLTWKDSTPSKITAINNAPLPQNISQQRSFLGLLNCYGRFIPNLVLFRKDKMWNWTKNCQAAFQELTTLQVLTHFNPSLKLQLACNASPYAVGAVLSHVMPNGEEKPIALASRTLNKAELNHAQLEREALSIFFGVGKFHQYLYGRNFTLLTNNRPLTTILGPHTGVPSLVASRLQRWALLLSAHSYNIKYRKTDLHCNPDGLFRFPLPITKPKPNTTDIFYFKEVSKAPVSAV